MIYFSKSSDNRPLAISLMYNHTIMVKNQPLVIGIAGGTGSGKTTVANVILDRVGAHRIAVLPHDAYYQDLSHLTLDAAS